MSYVLTRVVVGRTRENGSTGGKWKECKRRATCAGETGAVGECWFATSFPSTLHNWLVCCTNSSKQTRRWKCKSAVDGSRGCDVDRKLNLLQKRALPQMTLSAKWPRLRAQTKGQERISMVED